MSNLFQRSSICNLSLCQEFIFNNHRCMILSFQNSFVTCLDLIDNQNFILPNHTIVVFPVILI